MLPSTLQVAVDASRGSAHVAVSCSEAGSANPRPGVRSVVTGIGYSAAADSTGHPRPELRETAIGRDSVSCLVLFSLCRHVWAGPRPRLSVEGGPHLAALQGLRGPVVAQQEGGRVALRGAQEPAEGGQLLRADADRLL